MYTRVAVCIDDDPHTMNIVQQTLLQLGYHIEVAHTQADAIRLVAELKPALAYVSNEMEGVNALALFQDMQQVSNRTKGILLTSLASGLMVMVTGRHGINQVLVKPADHTPVTLSTDE